MLETRRLKNVAIFIQAIMKCPKKIHIKEIWPDL